MSSASKAVRPVHPAGGRGQWTRPAPEGEPACPKCGRLPVLSQPDAGRPDELLGSCDNRACLEWTVFARREGRWHVVRRISAEERRNPDWKPARPSTADTARRDRA